MLATGGSTPLLLVPYLFRFGADTARYLPKMVRLGADAAKHHSASYYYDNIFLNRREVH